MGSLDVDELAELSEEEIEKRLAAGMDYSAGKESMEESFQEDVLDILEDVQDSDLSEIKDLLKKSDNNQSIADSQISEKNDNPADRLLADIESAGMDEMEGKKLDSREEKALEKKRRKEEKRAAKEAAKEAKRALKKSRKDKAKTDQEESSRAAGNDSKVEEYDLSMDKDLLDSIVSGAGRQAEKKRQDRLENLERDDLDAGEDMAALLGSFDNIPDTQKKAAPSEPVMELDLDEVDAFIPDITDTQKEAGEENKKEKKGLMSKLIMLLTEEEEPEEENEDIRLSEENQEILDELDEENASVVKGKKGKKKEKASKAKKADKKKEPKPKKPPKPKKEKKPKEEEPYTLGKKLTFKKMLPVLLLGATIGAVIFIFVNLAVDFSVKSEAISAYIKGDYETCYLNLYGKKLNEEQEMMYGKSESILHMRLRYREYELYMEEGDELGALDKLIQSVADYPKLYENAVKWDAAMEIGEVYSVMLNILNTKYGVTEQRAQEIAAIKSNIKYTKAITALLQGNANNSEILPETDMRQPEEAGSAMDSAEDGSEVASEEGAQEGQPEDSAEELDDMLPEEADLENGNFVDNQ